MDSKLTAMVEAGRGSSPPQAPTTSGPAGMGPKSPGPKEEKSWKWTKRIAVVAAIVAAALIGKHCGSEKPVTQVIEQGCKAPSVCMSDPKPVTCDINKGTPGTMFFDANCVYCGKTDPSGKYVKADWMTPANCPIVFTCGNGVLDKDTPYPVYVKDGKGQYVWSTASVTESCKPKDANYCEADCPTKAAVGGGRGAGSAGPAVSATPPVVNTNVTCDKSIMRGELSSRIGSAVMGSAGEIKTAVGTSGSVTVFVGVRVDANGNPRVTSITPAAAKGALSIDLSGITTARPENECNGTVAVKIPGE
jgi:hypothetical protein